MQQSTAQQRWDKLELPLLLKQGTEAQTDKGNQATFADLIDVVLHSIETDAKPPTLRSGNSRNGMERKERA
jgi:hypothetical protein